jgi:ectoine hydroxylase-related dioxygenase (phytanoyl-CoA dioxygenase family)
MNNTFTKQHLQKYWKKGYVILLDVFTKKEVQEFQAESDRLLSLDIIHPNNIRTPFRQNSGHVPERIDPVIDISPVFLKIAKDKRLLEIGSAIFQDEPLLFKDKFIIKAPNAHGYPMHQDQAWWQLCPADDVFSISIAIDPADKKNGCVEMFAGYHHEMLTPKGDIRQNISEKEMSQICVPGEMIEMMPGSVAVFHSLTPHQSGTNFSNKYRRTLFLTYSASRSSHLRETYYKQYNKYEKIRDIEPDKKKFYL